MLDAVLFTGREYTAGPEKIWEKVEAACPYPVIVKPVNLGSSVGISRAGDREELKAAVDEALSYSGRILVERAVPHLREINCAVLGDYDTAEASVRGAVERGGHPQLSGQVYAGRRLQGRQDRRP